MFISIISLLTIFDFTFIKAIRVLRLFRPLRVIQKNEGLKVAIKALFMAIPNITYVSIIAMLFFAIFGMTGVNMFKGAFFTCKGIQDNDLANSVNDKYDWFNKGGVWLNADATFDNIMEASRTLFEMSTTEGWVNIMYNGIDSVDIDKQPKTNYSPTVAVYFIMFIVVGSFFILNLFVGVVISTFNLEKENLGKNYLLTATQKEWIDTRLDIVKIKPVKISKYSNNICYKIAESKYFEIFIIIWIIFNTAALAVNWYGRQDSVQNILDIWNYVFSGIFTIEAIIRIVGLGPKKYFTEKWNIFDFIIIIGSYISLIIEQTTSYSLGVQTTILRAFRISRMLRLVKRAKSLNIIFETFLITIPALANIGGLLLLLLYLYSIIGVSLFAEVKLQSNLNSHANFQTFYKSFLTLFRASTGEGWNDLMHDISRTRSSLP